MDAAATQAWCALLRVPGLGPATGRRLLDRYGDPVAILRQAARHPLPELPAKLQAALAAPDWAAAEQDLQWLAAANHSLLCGDDPAYPQRLREIDAAPLALFLIGEPALLHAPQLAIVGARSATPQGLDHATAFAAELCRRGLAVTSGLALGIDGAAHRGALAVQGATLAVCGNGLDRVYPARHRELARTIAAQGLLISEFPLGTPPKPEHFPRRNRIISGLALGVLVVEAARESGSLITARLAAEQGREVFAIPGAIHNPMARGCHALIREGARLVENVDDILEELAALLPALPATAAPTTGPKPPADATRRDAPGDALDEADRRLLAVFGDAPVDFDTLLLRSGLSLAVLSTRLLALELQGHVAVAAGDTYMRRRRP